PRRTPAAPVTRARVRRGSFDVLPEIGRPAEHVADLVARKEIAEVLFPELLQVPRGVEERADRALDRVAAVERARGLEAQVDAFQRELLAADVSGHLPPQQRIARVVRPRGEAETGGWSG